MIFHSPYFYFPLRFCHRLPVAFRLLSVIWCINASASCNYFQSFPIFSFSFSLSCGCFCWGTFLCFSPSSPSTCSGFGRFLCCFDHGAIFNIIIFIFISHLLFRFFKPIALFLHCLTVLCSAPPSFLCCCANGVRCLVAFLVVSPRKSCFNLQKQF